MNESKSLYIFSKHIALYFEINMMAQFFKKKQKYDYSIKYS